MVELSIKYLSSCALTEEHETMEDAVNRINALFSIYECFYGSQNGVATTKKLKLLVVPTSEKFVAQVVMPEGYKNKLLVVFRAEEKQK